MKLGFLWSRAKQFKRELALISGITLVSSVATLAVPWLAGQLLGSLFDTAAGELHKIAALLALALVVLSVLNIAGGIMSAATSGRILAQLRADAYRHIQLLPIAFHDQKKRGDLLAIMTYEVDNLSGFLTSTIASIPAIIFTAGGAVILLFLIDPAMALIVPVIVPLFFIVMKLIGRRLRSLATKAREVEAEMMWVADSDLEMLPAIKAFAAEDQHRQNYRAIVERSRKLSLREDRITQTSGAIVALISALAAIAIILLAGDGFSQDSSKPGELFAFLLYAALLTQPVGGLVDVYGQFQIANGTVRRLEDILSHQPEPGYAGGKSLNRAIGALTFEGVSFHYHGRERVLDSVNLDIVPGEILALTGRNGAGKSTLIKLLLRFYEPDRGRVLLDGTDIAKLQVQDLRRQFGYVPQRALLFSGTVAENIALGNPSASDGEVRSAARLAQAIEFIEELPHGLETEIGDNGVQLSGGQRQRIALARALLPDPPILIFDEATSMFDLEGEAAFITECEQALEGRTVLLVTHREASLALAKRVIEVSNHKVAETPNP